MNTSDADPVTDQGVQPYFASLDRAPPAELLRPYQPCLHNPISQAIPQAVQGYVLILNHERRVAAATREVLGALRRKNEPCGAGLHPVELCNRVHFTPGTNGCGTASHSSPWAASVAGARRPPAALRSS